MSRSRRSRSRSGRSADINYVKSLPSAASVTFYCWGKMQPLNIFFVVVYALPVQILCPFECNPVGKVRFYLKNG